MHFYLNGWTLHQRMFYLISDVVKNCGLLSALFYFEHTLAFPHRPSSHSTPQLKGTVLSNPSQQSVEYVQLFPPDAQFCWEFKHCGEFFLGVLHAKCDQYWPLKLCDSSLSQQPFPSVFSMKHHFFPLYVSVLLKYKKGE